METIVDILLVLLFLGMMFGILYLCATWEAKHHFDVEDEREAERELFERIMREGTDEQKLIALQYKQMKKLSALEGLVLFDIFFR